MNLFTPNHVQLLNSCYPPSSALLTSGPDYAPKSQEISRLTYLASNNPAKLTKLASELDKRLKSEARKARSGNLRSRASLLISLSIFRSLATECRRDISLLSPSLISSVDATIRIVPSDLEVIARSASVFSAWTTYTDGHLIGTDSSMTRDYLSSLRGFSTLASSTAKDSESRNRNRLIGLAAITGALNSEALYNDAVQFKAQISIILHPIFASIFQTPYDVLDKQAVNVSKSPTSPYLAEFRSRPTVERRAASIHIHVDGQNGPSTSDVSDAAIHALHSLLEHANGAQLGYIMRSAFDTLEDMNIWSKTQYCCWFAGFTAEWAQYQYRSVVPTATVEHLLQAADSETSSKHLTLLAMVSQVLNSPIPLINLSTSDIISNLMTLLLRKIAINAHDPIRASLVECIASLGTHVYYSDQVQDLAGELVNRLVLIELQGVPGTDSEDSRVEAIRCIVAGLVGLMEFAQKHDQQPSHTVGNSPKHIQSESSTPAQIVKHETVARLSRRTKVPPDIWQDTLSLLCDTQYSVRAEYAYALVKYVSSEYPIRCDTVDTYGSKEDSDRPKRQDLTMASLLSSHECGVHFLDSIHAYVFVLATSTRLGLRLARSSSPSIAAPQPSELPPTAALQVFVQPATPDVAASIESNGQTHSSQSQSNGRRSFAHVPRARKNSALRLLLEHVTPSVTPDSAATLTDYANILDILTTLQQHLPVHALLTGVPMLLALDSSCSNELEDSFPEKWPRVFVVRYVIAKVWLAIANRWECHDLIENVEKILSSAPSTISLPSISACKEAGYTTEPCTIVAFPPEIEIEELSNWQGIPSNEAMLMIIESSRVQTATGLDKNSLLERFSVDWSAQSALSNPVDHTITLDTARSDGISPLLKISPALMHIENISLQSLTRTNRGVGVTDLREALEGRSSMSNPALSRSGSVSTVDRGNSILMDGRLSATRSQVKKRNNPPYQGEVKDVLSKLGIGKQHTSSRLKPSFPKTEPSTHKLDS